MRTQVSTLLIAFMILATLGRPVAAEQTFLRGDSNQSGDVTLADALTTLGHIFVDSPESLPCRDAADANDNGSLTLADALYTLRFLFVDGPEHPAPGNECGTDPTDDDLDCAEFEPCPEDDPGDPGDPVETIEYVGDQIVLVGDVAPGESVAFDVDRDVAGFEVEVVADDDGVFTAVLDASGLDDEEVILRRIGDDGATEAVATRRTSRTSPENTVPEAAPGNVQAAICLCGTCTQPKLADALTRSREPRSHGVLLADGTFVERLSVLGFSGRLFDFRFDLYHQTLTDYAGPLGESMSHSFNLFIVQGSEDEGFIVTPDLRILSITRGSDDEWDLPAGFYGRLIRNAEQGRWILTLHQGTTFELLIGAEGLPGRLFRIREPNGNRMRVELDTSGRMTAVLTDLDQRVTFERNDDDRITAVVDPMGREWSFQYDDLGRLRAILTPESEFADIEAERLITDEDLDDVLETARRNITLAWDDPGFPNQLTAIEDPRGAVPVEWTFDDEGRVAEKRINGEAVTFDYDPTDDPEPLTLLESENSVVRVTDREENVRDYEIHGGAGGPRDGAGRFGLRRKVAWTESGKGNAALRADEPDYWEQRWLHDCDCLAPIAATEPFGSDESLTFDADGIPEDWPRTLTEFNDRRQVTRTERTDGDRRVVVESTYAGFEEFSRPLTHTGARAFDPSALDDGLEFTVTSTHDDQGNLIERSYPTVTVGVLADQEIVESWTFNEHGQELTHTRPDGNVTEKTYHDGDDTAGDINSAGDYRGYLASETRGAAGSADAAPELTVEFQVNPIGMVTRKTDPRGFTTDTEYNDVGEEIRVVQPEVTLAGGETVRYETVFVHDSVGNTVLERRSNVDVSGVTPVNAWTDTSRSFDAANNVLAVRTEIDEDDDNDLIWRLAYDGNEQVIVQARPLGNRLFEVYDERGLLLRSFHGVAAGDALLEGYPSSKTATTLGSTAFIAMTERTYDARENLTTIVDGRSYRWIAVYDFLDRLVAAVDPNLNGLSLDHDHASNIVTRTQGTFATADGTTIEVLSRTYYRHDEVNRAWARSGDLDLDDDESDVLDLTSTAHSTTLTRHDAGGRRVARVDANGNERNFEYDAADRMTARVDALDNRTELAYDSNSNLEKIVEIEEPGLGASGDTETYVTTFEFDELNRRTALHDLGLDESIDDVTRFAYDSRGNLVVEEDSLGNATLRTHDDADRLLEIERFDGNPLDGTPTTSSRMALGYDANGNRVTRSAFPDVDDDDSEQITRMAFDDLDRRVRRVLADSDDPIDGTDDGADGVFDREQWVYDENGNDIEFTDPRGVLFENTFDPANRREATVITLTDDVEGVTEQRFEHDGLNRLIAAENDYSRIEQEFDVLSRRTAETQWIRLDGTGFTDGWEEPITVRHQYDVQSNPTRTELEKDGATQLIVERTFDALNRVSEVSGEYFDVSGPVAEYLYHGPERVTGKVLGNDAVLERTFDAKQRVATHQWRSGSGSVLVGHDYTYDAMDNMLSEGFTHDDDRYDHFDYNDRYEVVGATYRNTEADAPAEYRDTFAYDDNAARTTASYGNPFAEDPAHFDLYETSATNEYTSILRDDLAQDTMYDRGGNATRYPVLPELGFEDQPTVMARCVYDAFNQMLSVEADGPTYQYRYDAFGRRFVTLTLSGGDLGDASRRYIHDGSVVISEELFTLDAELDSAPSTLERVYLNGALGETLLAAIDRDGDGELGGDFGKNVRDIDADQEYYFLDNVIGSVMGILDADFSERVLEYYRYEAFGSPTILPAIEDDEGLELTPLDLEDNYDPEYSPRVSEEFGNTYFFRGLRYDSAVGLYPWGQRYLEPLSGVFLSPVGAGVLFQQGQQGGPLLQKKPKKKRSWGERARAWAFGVAWAGYHWFRKHVPNKPPKKKTGDDPRDVQPAESCPDLCKPKGKRRNCKSVFAYITPFSPEDDALLELAAGLPTNLTEAGIQTVSFGSGVPAPGIGNLYIFAIRESTGLPWKVFVTVTFDECKKEKCGKTTRLNWKKSKTVYKCDTLGSGPLGGRRGAQRSIGACAKRAERKVCR